MDVKGIRWVGVATDHYDAMSAFLSEVMGLGVNFDEGTTIEFTTSEDDRVQVIAPGHPTATFFGEHAIGPVPLFEVADLDVALRELQAAGVEVLGQRGRDSHWEWIDFRAPDGNIYELGSRLTPADQVEPSSEPGSP